MIWWLSFKPSSSYQIVGLANANLSVVSLLEGGSEGWSCQILLVFISTWPAGPPFLRARLNSWPYNKASCTTWRKFDISLKCVYTRISCDEVSVYNFNASFPNRLQASVFCFVDFLLIKTLLIGHMMTWIINNFAMGHTNQSFFKKAL